MPKVLQVVISRVGADKPADCSWSAGAEHERPPCLCAEWRAGGRAAAGPGRGACSQRGSTLKEVLACSLERTHLL